MNMKKNRFVLLSCVALLSAVACTKDPVTEQPPEEQPPVVEGAAYEWPVYYPGISYDFREEFPVLEAPTKILEDSQNVAGTISSDWWCFRWGPNAHPLISEAAIRPMLDYFESEFAYFRDVMGWPPDKRARNGYKSAIYLYGSGLSTDNADSTALGGWQGSVNYQGQSWPMVLASYYPVYSFDPDTHFSDAQFQRSAMIHEGIHAVLADYEGVRNSAWFHEGGNVWFQQTMDAARSQDYSSLGWLGAGDAIAPFIPIESYSGWLLDGSFGGPSAEGVNLFEGNQQICTWRRLLGGKQYSSVFPTYIGEVLGNGANPWIWRFAKDRVLAGIADGIGEKETRRLIVEYRARQALADMGKWREAYVGLIDDSFGMQIAEEWEPYSQSVAPWVATPYVKTSVEDRVLIPDPYTLPGWSGGNQIPLTIERGAKVVRIAFEGLMENMTCQLAYRNKDGETKYSQYIHNNGEIVFNVEDAPVNGVVIAVVANTDFIYEDDETRKKRFDYRIEMGEGIQGAADINTRWYQWEKMETTGGSAKLASSKVGIDWGKLHPKGHLPRKLTIK